eukprot:COSAG06_NODE_259_length_18912_cov_53.912614_12_plen_239_part_00
MIVFSIKMAQKTHFLTCSAMAIVPASTISLPARTACPRSKSRGGGGACRSADSFIGSGLGESVDSFIGVLTGRSSSAQLGRLKPPSGMPITSGMFPVASRYITSGSCGPIAAAAAAAAAATSSSYFVASCTSCPSTALFFLSGYVSHAVPFSPSTLHPSSRQPAGNAFCSHFCSDHMCPERVLANDLISMIQKMWRYRVPTMVAFPHRCGLGDLCNGERSRSVCRRRPVSDPRHAAAC